MTSLQYDPTASRVTIETRAKGMLAKLAHDLSIAAREVTATATIDAGRAAVELRVPVSKLEVEGVRKGNEVARGVLSVSDRTEIQQKIQSEVLKSRDVVITMEAPLGERGLEEGSRTLEATGRVEVGGHSARVTSRCELHSAAGRVTVRGRAKVSLPALSIPPPKGPLGAFRVDDDVDIAYELAFTRQGP